jgi:hypothetical protein
VLAALVHGLELRPHQAAQQAAPAERREDPDHRDPARADAAAGNGELERVRTAPTGELAVDPDRVHPLDRKVPREALGSLLVRVPAEVVADPPERLAELLEVAARPDLDAQAIFSSGA